MSKLYMMRHGQTLFNVLKRKQGWCDSPLTELGIEQAKRAGEELRERGITFDHAYSSTSERACDTLELVVPGMPYELSLIHICGIGVGCGQGTAFSPSESRRCDPKKRFDEMRRGHAQCP